MTPPDRSEAVGSSLLGQPFKTPEYLHPRPSAAGSGYDAANSSGTNLGPISDKLLNGVADDPKTKDVDESFTGIKQLVEAYRAENKLPASTLVPADAVTRSGSGLDPDITPANAGLQAARIATARGVNVDEVRALLNRQTKGRQWGSSAIRASTSSRQTWRSTASSPSGPPRGEGRRCSVRALTQEATGRSSG